ncbi:MAG: aldolase/citrate lyase family protein [Candidatus Obscuribacterales bacterium]
MPQASKYNTSPHGSLPEGAVNSVLLTLAKTNATFAHANPGERNANQPDHTVYGGANLFKADTAGKLGKLGLKALTTYAPNWVVLARALKLPGHEKIPESEEAIAELLELDDPSLRSPEFNLPHKVYVRLVERLKSATAIEDVRVDFEDGYGYRSDADEDAHAHSAALEMAKGLTDNTLPPYIGIRIKPFTEELKMRSVRTLDIFVTTLLRATGGILPPHFVVTLPKVTTTYQVTALVELLRELENASGLSLGTIKIELMIETPQSIIGLDGYVPLRNFADAADKRLRGVAFGTYDYTALIGVAGTHQAMGHPACDYARQVMLTALSGTGIWCSDGATTAMPIGPFTEKDLGRPLTEDEMAKNQEKVHEAWKLAYDNVMDSLIMGLYQGWDLNPAQLVSRYAALYAFFLGGMPEATERLSRFVNKASQATLTGNAFDDAATGQGFLNFFLRALSCGAATEEEVLETTGLTRAELRTRSFKQIVDARSARNSV